MFWDKRSKAKTYGAALLLVAVQITTAAPAVPPEVISQLRNLSPSEAQALARQYGIDPSTYFGQGGGGPAPGQAPAAPTEPPAQVKAPPPPAPAPSPATPSEALETTASAEEVANATAANNTIEALEPAKRYGLGFFKASGAMLPTDNAPVPPDYRLGVGDEVVIFLVGLESNEIKAVIDRHGEIALPNLGKVALAGTRFDDAVALIKSKFSNSRIGVEAFITLGRLRMINVTFAGEVNQPGTTTVGGLTRLSQAIAAAGGLSALGSLRNIELRRGSDEPRRFDAYDLLLRGDASGDLRLQDGDILFVPTVGSLAAAMGEVRRPGVYEVLPDERLSDLLLMAGGTTERALTSHVLLEHEVPEGVPEIQNLTFPELSLRNAQAGDRIRILPSADRFANRITLSGAIQRPGIYGFEPGLAVSDLISDPDLDLLESTDFKYALRVSTRKSDGFISVQPFSLEAVMTQAYAPELSPRDEVIILPRAGLGGRRPLIDRVVARLRAQATPSEPAKIVTIRGPLRDPGAYPHQAGLDIGQLIDAAGGFREALVDFDYGLIVSRANPALNDGKIEVRKFSLNKAITRGSFPRLHANDEVIILPQPGEPGRRGEIDRVVQRLRGQATPSEPTKVVTIQGPIRAPGAYPYEPFLQLKALMDAAGGFVEAEIDFDFGLILSTDPLTGVLTYKQFSPRAFLSPGHHEALSIALQPKDQVVLLPRASADDALRARRQAVIAELTSRLLAQATPERPAALASIGGAVFAPGTYPISENTSVAELIAAAGGLREGAYETEVEVRSVVLSRNGDAITQTRTVDLRREKDTKSSVLLARDQVFVRRIPGLDEQESITLAGEVRFPGTYPIAPGEMLSEVLARAGGVTLDAFPYGAVYTSRTQAAVEADQLSRFTDELRRTFAAQTLTLESPSSNLGDLEQTLAALTSRETAGRISVDFPGLLLGKAAADIEVHDGDRLFIPGKSSAVAVLGEVFRPGNFQFSESLKIDDYLALSAGTTKRADRGKIYVVRADGSVFRPERGLLRFNLSKNALRPGDAIVVPVDTAYRDTLGFWTTITQIAFQTGVSLASIRQFN